jgi:multidrug efflux pump subunit AcrA (membrane-fusion protein)
MAIGRETLRITLPLVILGGGVAGMVFLMWDTGAPAHVVEKQEPPLVKTVPVEAHEAGLEIEVDGVVVPYREIALSAEVEGRIEYKNEACRAGKYVEEGTLLLKIDSRDYELEIRRLVCGFGTDEDVRERLAAGGARPESMIGLAERDLEFRKKELKRYLELKRRRGLTGSSATSDEEVDKAEQSVIVAENTLETLRAQLEKAKLDLERTEINAPIDGVVVSDSVEQGDFVRRGEPLVTIEDTSKVEVKCSLRVDELYWLWNQTGLGPGDAAEDDPQRKYQIPDAPVTVVYGLAGRDYLWEGVLSRYERVGLDETTRTVPCRVVVEAPRDVCAEGPEGREGPDGRPGRCTGPPALVRGMFVTVRIQVKPQAKLVRIPEAAVQPGNRVWVVRGSKLAVVNVRVAQVADDAAILLAASADGGLEAGDRVVITPLSAAESGTVVREQAVR